MRARYQVIFAIVMSVAVATMAPGAAAAEGDESLVVGSQHTTDADFNNAQNLTNLSVVGSGESATVELNTSVFTDGFEDEAADSGVPDNWEAVSDVEGNGFTRSGTDEVSGTVAHSGSQSYRMSESGSGNVLYSRPAEQPYSSNRTDNTTVWVNQSSGGTDAGLMLLEGTGDTAQIQVEMREGNLTYHDGTGLQTISTVPNAGEWVRITVYDIDPSTDTFAVEWETAGDSGRAAGLSMKSAMTDGWDNSVVFLNEGEGHFDDVTIGKDPDSAAYLSPIHNVDNSEEAAINITALTNASVTATVQTDTGTVLNQTTISSTGNHTLTLSSTSSSSIEVKLDISISGSNPAFSLGDESILFVDHAPEIAEGTATPSGDANLNDSQVTLEVNVSDAEFATAQGEELTAEIFVDGSKIDTQTVTSNGTVSTTTTVFNGGDHTWSVDVTDKYGLQAQSKQFQFNVPDTLYIRNETNTSQLVDSAEIEVQFIASNKVVTKSTTNGKINLTGLPVDEQMVISATGGDFRRRHIIIDSIYEQESIYLLHNNITAKEVRFTITDTTGQFPPEDSEIFVEKPLNRSGTTEFRVVAADEHGVNGFTTNLEADQRYLIKVRNDQGDTRTLGSYTASVAETVELRPVAVGIDVGGADTYVWNASRVDSSDSVKFEYGDPDNATTSLSLKIYEQGNESNVIHDKTYSDTFGTLSVTEPIPANYTNATWVVDWSATRNGETITGQATVGIQIYDPVPGVAQWVKEAVAILFVILTAALFSQLNRSVGAVATSFIGGGFWVSGWLPTEAGAAIVIALGVSVLYKIAGGR